MTLFYSVGSNRGVHVDYIIIHLIIVCQLRFATGNYVSQLTYVLASHYWIRSSFRRARTRVRTRRRARTRVRARGLLVCIFIEKRKHT